MVNLKKTMAISLLAVLTIAPAFAGNVVDCAKGVNDTVKSTQNQKVPATAVVALGVMTLNLASHAKNEGKLLAGLDPDTGKIVAPGYDPAVSQKAAEQAYKVGKEVVEGAGMIACAEVIGS